MAIYAPLASGTFGLTRPTRQPLSIRARPLFFPPFCEKFEISARHTPRRRACPGGEVDEFCDWNEKDEDVAMKRAWSFALAGAVMGLMTAGQLPAVAGHGHGGSSHPAKESHESKGSKPAPHPAPKHESKPQSKPQPKHEPKAQPKHDPKSQSKHESKPKENNLYRPPGHSLANEHPSNVQRPNAVVSSTTASKSTSNSTTTHHDEHHDGHHFHHERFWHGHHLWWSGTAWVDGAGQPYVAADLVPPVEVGGGPGSGAVAAPMSVAPMSVAPVAGGPQIQFSVDPSETQAYDRAAQAAGVSRNEWIRSRLNSAAQQELK
jgi:outer membrane biosynthesis protein TonB